LTEFMGMFSSGDSGPSQTEMMEGGFCPKVSAFANKNVRIGQPTDRGGIGAMLEATAQPAPEQTGVTPAATAAINRSSDANRGVPLAALEERMKKARMNITGPSVFDNPADVQATAETHCRASLKTHWGKAPAFREYQPSMPRTDRPEVRGRMMEAWRSVLDGVKGGQRRLQFGNVPSIFDLQPKDTERRDPSGEPPKQTTTETKPDDVVKKPNPNADDPKSPGGGLRCHVTI
jgi:hypothetical protein